MERKPPSKADKAISEPGLWESEIAFGPHREAQPDEKYDPEDLTSGHKLIPVRKYGPGLDQNKSEET